MCPIEEVDQGPSGSVQEHGPDPVVRQWSQSNETLQEQLTQKEKELQETKKELAEVRQQLKATMEENSKLESKIETLLEQKEKLEQEIVHLQDSVALGM